MSKEDSKDKKIKELEAKLDMFMQAVGAVGAKSNNMDVNSYVEFESVSTSPVYLATNGDGQGEIYSFEHFGDTVSIPIVDARNIIRHNRNFINEGVVYIKDEGLVAAENLTQQYTKIIDAKSMKNLLLCKRQEFDKRFTPLTDTQKETVYLLLFNMVKDGKKVDEEILFYIYQVTGKDIKTEVSNLKKLTENIDD